MHWISIAMRADGPARSYAGIGARDTPPHILATMRTCGRILAERGLTLRSGGADGADTAFDDGVAKGGLREIYLPWAGFNKVVGGMPPSCASITAEAKRIAAAAHPAWDRCSDAAKKMHARNVHQVLGAQLDDPSAMIICFTKDGLASGGTGQAIRIAELHGIPVINLRIAGHLAAVEAALGFARVAPTQTLDTPEAAYERRAAMRRERGR